MAIRSDVDIRTDKAKRAMRMFTQFVQQQTRKQGEETRKEGRKTEADYTARMKRMGESAKRWIGGIAVGAVYALARAFNAGRAAAVKFEKQMAEVATLVNC